jgi:hypothetical protein
MPLAVVTGASIMCSFGLAPGVFTATPPRPTACGLPVGTITDIAPMTNISSFGMCTSLANPSVAAATAAALGVLTPMPCTPVPVRPWTPAAPTTLVGNVPILASGCNTQCAWAGIIQVVAPGQFVVQAK